jgi:hypothetical protein
MVIYECTVMHTDGTRATIGFVVHDASQWMDTPVIDDLFCEAGYLIGMRSSSGPDRFPDAHYQQKLSLVDARAVVDCRARRQCADWNRFPRLSGAVWPIDDPRPPGEFHQRRRPHGQAQE